jgi:hypothetical protein
MAKAANHRVTWGISPYPRIFRHQAIPGHSAPALMRQEATRTRGNCSRLITRKFDSFGNVPFAPSVSRQR